MSYTERLVASPLVACTWEQTTTAARELRIVRDVCVDVIWSREGPSIAGPDTRARVGPVCATTDVSDAEFSD